LIGRVLGGRYTIQERIGGGGMSVVYRAFDSLLRRPVAVKVLRPEFVSEADIVHRFRQEAQAAASLQHPNIVNVYDVGEDGETYFIVMEYVPGRTLKAELQDKGPEPPERAAALTAEILAALEEAHAHGIVHRDVKPQNVLLSKSGHAKVSDFGIARAAASATIVHTARALGTAHYASPEQVRGAPTDERSDVYSVGCVLFEALTGRPPFPGEDALAVMWQHTQSEAPDPRELRPSVPAALAAVTRRALAKRPEERYPSAAAMLADLERTIAAPAAEAQPQLGRRAAAKAAGGGRAPRAQLRPAADGPALGAAADLADTVRLAPSSREPFGTVAAAAASIDGTLDLAAVGEQALPAARPQALRPQPVPARAPAERPQPAPRRRQALLRWVIVLAVLAGVVYAALYLFSQALQVPTVRVPNVVGRTTAQASAMLTAVGLQPNVATVPSASVAPGDVISASPAPGSAVKKGRQVDLAVSTGPEIVSGGVPNLAGLGADAAASMLQSLGLVPKETQATSASVPAGQVIGSEPPAGAPARQGDTVTIQVSSGPPAQPATVPALIGQTVADAESALQQAGLQTGSITQSKSGYPAGYVVATDPAAQSQLTQGQSVNLTVSSGCDGSAPLQLTVPATATAPVQVLVTVVDQMPSPHPIYQGQQSPGASLTVNACWLGPAAHWTAYANGTEFASGILNGSGAH
jgi:beta-lactam-binding protein with PASTA domain/predicted Ser/Thr protein kinase